MYCTAHRGRLTHMKATFFCTAAVAVQGLQLGPIDEHAQSLAHRGGEVVQLSRDSFCREFLGVQSKCQSNFNYGSENIGLEMELGSKVIKKIKVL